MKTEPRHYILQAKSLPSKEATWQDWTPVSYLPCTIPFFSLLEGETHSTRDNMELGRLAHITATCSRLNWTDIKKQQVQKTNGTRAGGNAAVCAQSMAATKGLQLQHGTGSGLRPVPTQGPVPLQASWVGGMQMSCASGGSTGLMCLTSCRWETAGNVSRSGFESWPVVTINKKLKSFTVCTCSF